MIKLYHFIFDKMMFLGIRNSEIYGNKLSHTSFYLVISGITFSNLSFFEVAILWNTIKNNPCSTELILFILILAFVLSIFQLIYLVHKDFVDDVYKKYNFLSKQIKSNSRRKWMIEGVLPLLLFPVLCVLITEIIDVIK